MRLPGCPSLGKGMASAHVPLGVGCNWHPTPEEYLRWCFCVPVNQHVVWGSTISRSSSSVSDGTRFLFPHERWVVQAWWECLRQACADTHRVSRESFDYGLVGTSWYQFLLRVDVQRNSDRKFLDLSDFTRRHMFSRVQGLEGAPADRCHHRTHNKSYVLLAMGVLDSAPADGRDGSLLHFRAKTHMPRSPPKKRKTDRAQPYLGTTLDCSDIVVGYLCENFGAHTFAEFQRRRTLSRDHENDEIAVSVQVPRRSCVSGSTTEAWQVSPWFVRKVLWARYGETREQEKVRGRWCDAQRKCAAVAFLATHARKPLALRAVLTELKHASTRKEAHAHVASAFLEAEKLRVLARGEEDPETLHELWTPVLAFAERVVYRNEVY